MTGVVDSARPPHAEGWDHLQYDHRESQVREAGGDADSRL
jgi:hypothetical protein